MTAVSGSMRPWTATYGFSNATQTSDQRMLFASEESLISVRSEDVPIRKPSCRGEVRLRLHQLSLSPAVRFDLGSMRGSLRAKISANVAPQNGFVQEWPCQICAKS